MNWDVRRFETIDSTNRYLLEEAASGAPAGLVAAAGHQTEGRGRRGRVWDSKPGASLLVSILFRPDGEQPLIRYPQAVGLAYTDALATFAGVNASLKWPNDVVHVREDRTYKKLAGILSEAVSGDASALVVGCGLNINWGDDMPPALRATAASVDELAGRSIEPWSFLDAMLAALNERLSRPTWISESYRQRCVTLGTPVRVEQSEAVLIGVAEAVTDEGALIVRKEDGDAIEVTLGEVVHVR